MSEFILFEYPQYQSSGIKIIDARQEPELDCLYIDTKPDKLHKYIRRDSEQED
jgi:hypothetical protein